MTDAQDQFFGYGESFNFLECGECSALVLDPRPAPTEIGRYYEGYYPDATLARLRQRAEQNKRVGTTGKLRALGTLKRLRKLGAETNADMKLLDVGCGLGAFGGAMGRLTDMKVQGVDFSAECQAFAEEIHGLPVDVGELVDQQYPDGSFDYVTSWHYLEHVYDPAAEIKEMARVLKPGGWFVSETPTPDIWYRVFKKRWFYLMPPTHLLHYRPATMKKLVEDAGLVVEHIARPWVPGELAGSLMLTAGLNGFVPKVLAPGRPLKHKMLTWILLAQMVYDIPVSLLLSMINRSGLLRVYARKL